jgi:hypothetical protein
MMNVRGLTKRTKEKRESDIVALSKKPIQEIWEKQRLVKAQQHYVFDQYTKAAKGHRFKEMDKLEKESEELAEYENDLKEAIKRK